MQAGGLGATHQASGQGGYLLHHPTASPSIHRAHSPPCLCRSPGARASAAESPTAPMGRPQVCPRVCECVARMRE